MRELTQKERQFLATRTEAPYTTQLEERLVKTARLLHTCLGMLTEVGEFADVLKKHIFYNKPLDLINLKEELGDLDYYVAIAAAALETDLSEIQRANVKKLFLRYGEKFSEASALIRDLDEERKSLEDAFEKNLPE